MIHFYNFLYVLLIFFSPSFNTKMGGGMCVWLDKSFLTQKKSDIMIKQLLSSWIAFILNTFFFLVSSVFV